MQTIMNYFPVPPPPFSDILDPAVVCTAEVQLATINLCLEDQTTDAKFMLIRVAGNYNSAAAPYRLQRDVRLCIKGYREGYFIMQG